MDSGKRSGHGRVASLYYELCGKIWGGSPATEQIDTGLETAELNVSSLEVNNASPSLEDVGLNEDLEKEIEQSPIINDSQFSSEVASTSEGHMSESDSSARSRIGRKRRADGQTLSSFNSYKQQKLKKKVPADSQMLHFAEREVELKE